MLRPFQTIDGFTLTADDGEIGKVQGFYFDDGNWGVRYLVVRAGSWLSGREVLIVPGVLGDVNEKARTIVVNLTCEQVRNSPAAESDLPISRQHEEAIHLYTAGSLTGWRRQFRAE